MPSLAVVAVHRTSWLQLAKDDPDTLPGHSPAHRKLMSATFEALSKEAGGKMYK